MTTTPRSEPLSPSSVAPSPSSTDMATSVRRDDPVAAAVSADDKQDAVAARVNRHQAEVAAGIARDFNKQDAVAARVNRHQAAVAAEARARQAAPAQGSDPVDRAAQMIAGVVYRVVRSLAFPYQLGRTVVEEIGRQTGRMRSSSRPV